MSDHYHNRAKWRDEHSEEVLRHYIEQTPLNILELADKVGVTSKTVREHIRRLCRKHKLTARNISSPVCELVPREVVKKSRAGEYVNREKSVPQGEQKYMCKCHDGESILWLACTARDKHQALTKVPKTYPSVRKVIGVYTVQEHRDIRSGKTGQLRGLVNRNTLASRFSMNRG
jgi:hypothetical protein